MNPQNSDKNTQSNTSHSNAAKPLRQIFNIYCDESCHLEHDKQSVMLIGGIWCLNQDVRLIANEIRQIKNQFNAKGELKWSKVSRAKKDFYLALADYFFKRDSLNFRCVVVEDKSKLDHAAFNAGDHNSFYYKMYYTMLQNILDRDFHYEIYLDIKDTQSQKKIEKLKEVLCNKFFDFDQKMIERMQQIRSHESELMQLADFLIGAIGYKNRKIQDNTAKLAVVEQLAKTTNHPLTASSPPWVKKFNIFIFSPQDTSK